MIETRRFHCEECNYYWETNDKANLSLSCPKCSGTKVHRLSGDRRYAKKARQKVRWSVSSSIRR